MLKGLHIHKMEVIIHFVRSQAPLLAPLFRSEAQALLLSELLLPGEEMSMTNLAERVGLPYPTVHREVARLLDAGLLVDRRVGRTRHRSDNQNARYRQRFEDARTAGDA